MKVINNIRKRKGVSPVIATVVLVAVTITIAVAVAYWMSGISSQYTTFEKVEIRSAICTLESPGNWKIQLKLKNTGTSAATMISVFINNLEVNNYDDVYTIDEWNTDMTTSEAITSGQEIVVELYIDAGRTGTTLSSGTTINIKIHSASGMDYIKLVELV